MRWSALRSRVESLFAERVAKRVRLHFTRFREREDRDALWALFIDGAEAGGAASPGGAGTPDERRAAGRHTPREFLEALEAYPLMAIGDALASPDALVRALAWLDRRVGKRRLRERFARGTDDMPALEEICFRARCAAESPE